MDVKEEGEHAKDGFSREKSDAGGRRKKEEDMEQQASASADATPVASQPGTLPFLRLSSANRRTALLALPIRSHRQTLPWTLRPVPLQHQLIMITPLYRAATPASEAGAGDEEEVY